MNNPQTPLAADDPRHGTPRGHYAGCRELCCRRARARYEKAGRLARLNGGLSVPAHGAQRRLKALMAIGWTSSDIADACGWAHRNAVLRIIKGQKGKPCTWVERKTHNVIAETFERLAMRLPEMTPYRIRCRNIAQRNGYLPPLVWDNIDDPDEQPHLAGGDRDSIADFDPIVVERFLARDLTPGLWATLAEKREIVRRWDGSHGELARMTGWKVERYTDRQDGAA